MVAQARQHGQAHDDLAADGPRARKLPGREGTGGGKVGGAVFGQVVTRAITAFARQVRDVVIGSSIAPKGAYAGELCVDLTCEVKAVVEPRGVSDAGGEPVPQGEGVVRSGQFFGKASGVGEA